MKKALGLVAVAAAVLSGTVGVGAADAAARPSVRACAVYESGRPFVGPMTLERRTNNWSRTLNSAPSGCMIWKNLSARKAFRVEVSFGQSCSSGSKSSSYAYTYSGATEWKVTGRTGRLELGRFVVKRNTIFCPAAPSQQ